MGPISEVDMVGAQTYVLACMNKLLCNTNQQFVKNFKLVILSVKQITVIFCHICNTMCGTNSAWSSEQVLQKPYDPAALTRSYTSRIIIILYFRDLRLTTYHKMR